MILSYQTIKELCIDKELVTPCVERTVHANGMSYGLGPASYDARCAQELIIAPKEFRIASTVERVKIPSSICAHLADKSSWARKGIQLFNTFFDPGFEGYPTIEIINLSSSIIHISKGSPICQFIFIKLDKLTERPYKGKYQNQPNKPVEAINEKSETQS